MQKSKPEDTIVFLATSPRLKDAELILDSLGNFFITKSEEDPSDRFNIITFNKNGIVYFENFTRYGEELFNFIKEIIPQIQNINLIDGISLALNLFIDVFKNISGRVFRLIILTDRKTENLEISEYLWELVKYVGTLPLAIDIVRLGVYEITEDKKLKRFIEPTGGSMYYYDSIEDAEKILIDLAKKKDFSKSKLSLGDCAVTEDNRGFIDYLAADLEKLPMMTDEISTIRCQICGNQENLYECPQCGVTSHLECLAHWANYSLIGELLPHIFRCQNCFRLLRLDQKILWNSQSNPEIDEDTEMFLHNASVLGDLNQEDLLREEEMELPELLFEKEPIAEIEIPEVEEIQEYIVWDEEDNEEPQLILIKCPNCGKFLTNEFKFCTECGKKI